MNVKEGFTSGFLVLGFVVFIVGFLAGALAIALSSLNFDSTALGFMVFMFGFITGMATIALVIVIVKLGRLERES